MTRSIELLKRTLFTLLASFSVVGLLFVVSCDNGEGGDPEPELYDLSGIYTFKEATLQSDIVINIGIPITVAEAGMDITDELAGGLLAEANCKDEENGAVKMQSNFELFYTCLNEADSDIKAGGWAINADTTELDLNLASPPLPSPIQMTLEELEIDEVNDVISGSILDFPLTPDLIEALAAGFLEGKTQAEIDAILAALPPVIQIDVDISFQKVEEI